MNPVLVFRLRCLAVPGATTLSMVCSKANTIVNKQIGNKIENNRTVSDYRRYSFIIIRKNSWPHEITDDTGVTSVTVLIQKEHWKDHGRLFEVHISKHSL